LQPRLYCGFWSSSTCAIGATKFWNARFAPTSSIATSRMWAADKVPDAKTMGRWGVALGADAIKKIHERLVRIAKEEGVVKGRRLRLDTTVVETNIHYPTDSSLLGDGVRVLVRSMNKITHIAGEVGSKLKA
jgi:hypothetical protein